MTRLSRPSRRGAVTLGRALLRLTFASLSALTLSCGAEAEPAQLAGPPAVSGGAGAGGSAAMAGSGPSIGGSTSTAGNGGATANPLGRARCQAPDGVSAAPENTQQALQLLNALPKPTTVACFVESLARPLAIYATNSRFSAQPALSSSSPRVFIKLAALWLSVVIDGDSSYLLEFGDELAVDPPRSIKGELELPISEPVAASAPYDQVQYGTGTVCGFCHHDEQHEDSMPFATAFSSGSFRPQPGTRVSIDSLRAQAEICDWQVEPHRCEMLSAVFGGGDVQETTFPDSMPTFF